MLHNSMSSSNRSVVDMIVSISLSLALSRPSASVTSPIVGTIFFNVCYFPSFTFFRANFFRLIFYISTDHFVLQFFDIVGWAMLPVKIVPKMTYFV